MAAASLLSMASSNALKNATNSSRSFGSGVFVCWAMVGKAKPIANPARVSSRRIFIYFLLLKIKIHAMSLEGLNTHCLTLCLCCRKYIDACQCSRRRTITTRRFNLSWSATSQQINCVISALALNQSFLQPPQRRSPLNGRNAISLRETISYATRKTGVRFLFISSRRLVRQLVFYRIDKLSNQLLCCILLRFCIVAW